jgi:hypothetical protein
MQISKSSGANLYGQQLRDALRSLDGFDGVFRRKSSHNQCQLAVGCQLDGSPIYPLHIRRGAISTPAQFHDKLGVVHSVLLFPFYAEERCTKCNRLSVFKSMLVMNALLDGLDREPESRGGFL